MALSDAQYFLDLMLVTEPTLTDPQRFVEEHEAFNNVLRDDGEPHLYITIPADNTVVYASFDDIMEILDGGTGVFFFGRPVCSWCRLLYPTLLQIAIEKDIVLYYYNIEYDRTAHNQNYVTFLDRLHDYLPVDDRNQTPGAPDFDPEIKRVTVPHIFVVRDGEVVAEQMMNRHPLLVERDFEGLDAFLRHLLNHLDEDFDGIDTSLNDMLYGLSDAERFVAEHEAFNNVLRDDGEPHHYVDLPVDNTIVYATFDDIMDILDGGSGVFFFGRPVCPWCRILYPTLLQVAIDKDIALYYYDIEYDRTAHNQNYITFLDRLHNYLPVDDRNQTPGTPDFDPEMKRVTVPHIFVVRDGVVVAEQMMNRHPLVVERDYEGLDAFLRYLLGHLSNDSNVADTSSNDTSSYSDSDSSDGSNGSDGSDGFRFCPVC